MTIELPEGRVRWTFPDDWLADKYDDWQYYRKQFQGFLSGHKGVDFIAVSPEGVAWLIEAKDYTSVPRDTDKGPLHDEIALKVRDTLAGVLAASKNAAGAEQTVAARACAATKLRVVVHLEQPSQPSKLFPRSVDPSKLRMKLRQMLRAVDPHALVVDCESGGVPWEVSWVG